MAIISGVMTGLAHPKIPIQIQTCNRRLLRDYNAVQLESKRVPRVKSQYFLTGSYGTRWAAYAGRGHHELISSNSFAEEPFWLTLMKEASWGLKSLLIFLLEQPGQLKYIEWPSFQSTLKTASLTLFLVALLIVALASVDSGLCYLLALILRKVP